jgi:predicted RNase H-like nuclease
VPTAPTRCGRSASGTASSCGRSGDALELIGIDGCRGGWVVAAADPALSTLRFEIVSDLEPVFARGERGQALIAIDMPIGLGDRTPRACDLEARRLLGRPRASSVFPAPCRAALAATTYRRACGLSRRALGVALSLECFNILPKIRQVDALMTPARQAFVREVHPELVFAVLSGRGHGLAEPKRTPEGERVRRRLLRPAAPRFDPVAVRRQLGVSRVARDDVIDAVACVVAASRIAGGKALVLPDGTVAHDARGLRMEIVA